MAAGRISTGMKAAVIDRYGGNDEVHIRDVELPALGRNDVLVKVQAASINPLDWKVRAGMIKILTGSRFPKILGSECAGQIAGTGAGGDPLSRGQSRRRISGDQAAGCLCRVCSRRRAERLLEALQSIELIRKTGLRNFSIDLIYGIPAQSFNSWHDSLSKALSAHLNIFLPMS